MTRKKQATKKATIAERSGRFIAKHGPNNARRLGRATGRGFVNAKNFATKFAEAFTAELKD